MGGDLLFVLLIGGTLYFLPAIVAGNRRHHQAAAIFFLNLLLGWTVLGWIAALVWACTAVEYSPTDRRAPGSEVRPKCPYCGVVNPTGRTICYSPKCGKPLLVPADTKTCPRCAEMVKAAAKVCRFCGYEFEPSAALAGPEN